MKAKDRETVRQHIKDYGSQELIDKIYGKNKYKGKIFNLMKMYKLYNTHTFMGELLVDELHTQWLIDVNFNGGFNEGEHYLIIESEDDLQSFENYLSENKNEEKRLEDTKEKIIASLKTDFKEDEEIISSIIAKLDNFTKSKDKGERYYIMKDVLFYVKTKKVLNSLFGVGVNYYKNLEKDFEGGEYGNY